VLDVPAIDRMREYATAYCASALRTVLRQHRLIVDRQFPHYEAPLRITADECASGSSQIVEVIDAGPPVVSFQTETSGGGGFGLGLVACASQDIVNMATSAGNGTNVFTAGNGDELFSRFNLQIVPKAVPGVVDLMDHTTFTGGTGHTSWAPAAAAISQDRGCSPAPRLRMRRSTAAARSLWCLTRMPGR
jgi:hypothetical protein